MKKIRLLPVLTAIMTCVPLLGGLRVSAGLYGDEYEYGELSYSLADEDSDGKNDCIIITDCDESAEKAEIPAEIDGLPVKAIGWFAFQDCGKLVSVSIPEGVETIGFMAFLRCKKLAEAEIPGSVSEIEANAFLGTAIYNSQSGPKYIGEWLIGCNGNDSELEVKEGTKHIADGVFSMCGSLEKITIPESVVSIGKDAFLGTKLMSGQEGIIYADGWAVGISPEFKEAYVKADARGIADSAFRGSEVTFASVPAGFKSISRNAFSECPELRILTVKDPDCEIYPSLSTLSSNEEYDFFGCVCAPEGSKAHEYAERFEKDFVRLGDVSENGSIDLADAIIIAKAVASKKIDIYTYCYGDFVPDDVIDLKDIIAIAKYILKPAAAPDKPSEEPDNPAASPDKPDEVPSETETVA